MEITKKATARLLFPAKDGDDNPVDLTTLAEVCFLLVGAGGRIEKKSGDSGWEIVSVDGVNDALSITLTPAETDLRPGRLYKYWAWGKGVDGDDVIATGEATVVFAEKC